MEFKVLNLAESSLSDLSKELESDLEYYADEGFEIKHINTFIDSGKYFGYRSIIVLEKKGGEA